MKLFTQLRKKTIPRVVDTRKARLRTVQEKLLCRNTQYVNNLIHKTLDPVNVTNGEFANQYKWLHKNGLKQTDDDYIPFAEGQKFITEEEYALENSRSNWYCITISNNENLIDLNKGNLIESLNRIVDPVIVVPYYWSIDDDVITFYINDKLAARRLYRLRNFATFKTSLEKLVALNLTITMGYPKTNLTSELFNIVRTVINKRFTNGIMDLSEFHKDAEFSVIPDEFLELASVEFFERILMCICKFFKNIVRLNLSGNNIYSLSPLGKYEFQTLKSLDLSRNNLMTLDDLCFVQHLPLIDLDISGNTVAGFFKEFTLQEVGITLPRLKTFNGRTVLEQFSPKPLAIIANPSALMQSFAQKYFQIFDTPDRSALRRIYHKFAFLTVTLSENQIKQSGMWEIVQLLKRFPATQHYVDNFRYTHFAYNYKKFRFTISGKFLDFSDTKTREKFFIRTFLVEVIKETEPKMFLIKQDSLKVASDKDSLDVYMEIDLQNIEFSNTLYNRCKQVIPFSKLRKTQVVKNELDELATKFQTIKTAPNSPPPSKSLSSPLSPMHKPCQQPNVNYQQQAQTQNKTSPNYPTFDNNTPNDNNRTTNYINTSLNFANNHNNNVTYQINVNNMINVNQSSQNVPPSLFSVNSNHIFSNLHKANGPMGYSQQYINVVGTQCELNETQGETGNAKPNKNLFALKAQSFVNWRSDSDSIISNNNDRVSVSSQERTIKTQNTELYAAEYSILGDSFQNLTVDPTCKTKQSTTNKLPETASNWFVKKDHEEPPKGIIEPNIKAKERFVEDDCLDYEYDDNDTSEDEDDFKDDPDLFVSDQEF